jgi:hypothetical protein
MKGFLIKWFKRYFVTREEYLKYMQAQNQLMEAQSQQIIKLSNDKNDYKTFTEELNKITNQK